MINILFVDDQFCRPADRSIYLARYGVLQNRPNPYVFHYETAEDGKGGYAVEPVLEHISQIPNLKAVICDMTFGGDELGVEILQAIRSRFPRLPVIILSSKEKQETVEKVLRLGASAYLKKMPRLTELEQALETALKGGE